MSDPHSCILVLGTLISALLGIITSEPHPCLLILFGLVLGTLISALLGIITFPD